MQNILISFLHRLYSVSRKKSMQFLYTTNEHRKF